MIVTLNLFNLAPLLFPDLQTQIMQSEIPLGLYTQPPNPPSNTNHDLPESRFQLRQTRSLQRQNLGSMYGPGMMPYGQMMYPPMMNMSPAQFGGPSMGGFGIPAGPVASDKAKKKVNPGQYIVVNIFWVVDEIFYWETFNTFTLSFKQYLFSFLKQSCVQIIHEF